MTRNLLGWSVMLLLQGMWCYGQDGAFMDSITVNKSLGLYEFNLHVPLGQTFISKTSRGSNCYVKAYRPDKKIAPHVSKDTLAGKLSTNLSWTASNHHYRGDSPQGKQYQMGKNVSSSISVGKDPHNYLMELNPSTEVPVALNMRLGYGSSRLDLSGLDVRKVNIMTSSTNVIISYKTPNRGKMEGLKITGGMSQIVLRNIEYAKAENVAIDNSMGDTRIILGNRAECNTNFKVVVGAGSCLFLAHKDIPMKLVLDYGFFSDIELSDDFIQTGENTFVNLPYKKNSQGAITVYADIGLGNFTLVTFEQ